MSQNINPVVAPLHTTQYRMSVPAQDEVTRNWIKGQHNISYSLRALIRRFVLQYGYIDSTCLAATEDFAFNAKDFESLRPRSLSPTPEGAGEIPEMKLAPAGTPTMQFREAPPLFEQSAAPSVPQPIIQQPVAPSVPQPTIQQPVAPSVPQPAVSSASAQSNSAAQALASMLN